MSSNNNVQRLLVMSDEGNFVCRHVEQIRTAARDGDCAVGVNLVRLHRTRSASVKCSPRKE